MESLGASEQAKIRGNYVCCLVTVVIFVGPGEAKRKGFFKVIIQREGEKAQTSGTLWVAITTELFHLELPTLPKGERKRKRQRQRERERETDRETDRDREIETERQRDRERSKEYGCQ